MIVRVTCGSRPREGRKKMELQAETKKPSPRKDLKSGLRFYSGNESLMPVNGREI